MDQKQKAQKTQCKIKPPIVSTDSDSPRRGKYKDGKKQRNKNEGENDKHVAESGQS